MRQWRSFWDTIEVMSQNNPPQLIETLMLVLSMVLFSIWIFHAALAYLLLGFVLTVGACASILVREALIPAVRPRPAQVMAALLLCVSLYGVADLLFVR